MAENPGAEEAEGFISNQDENIWQDREGSQDPDQTNGDVGALDGADLGVAQRDADSDVALYSHGGQIDRCVEGCEDCGDQQEAAEGHIQGEQDVAEDMEEACQGQLQHVVNHQVDEQDVARVGVEHLRR